MTLALLRLGVRLGIQPGYAARTRAVLLGVGVLTVTLVALVGLSVPGTMQRQDRRAADLAPVFGATDTRSSLSALDPEPLSSRRWDGRVVQRLAVSTGRTGAPVPIPGVSSTPRASEAVVSPRLLSLIRTDSTMRALMSHYRVVGTIRADGLVEPRELRAVVSVPARTRDLRPVVGFGGSAPSAGATGANTAVLNKAVGLFAGFLVSVPAGALVVMCSRLGSRQRRARIHSLRRLGVGRTGVRMVLATEVVLVAVPAVLLGGALYAWFAAAGDHLPGTEFGFFSRDLRLPGLTVLLVMAVLLALIATSAAVGVVLNEHENGRRRTPRFDGTRRAYAVVALAVALFASVRWLPDGPSKAFALWSALGLLAVGVALSANGLVAAISRPLARIASRGGTLVGLRLNVAEPGSTVRMASVIAALVVCLAGAVSFLTILNGATSFGGVAKGRDLVVNVQDFGGVLTLSGVKETKGVDAAAPIVDIDGDKDTVPTVVATCTELDRLLGHHVPRCSQDPAWLVPVPGMGLDAIRSESSTANIGGSTRTLPRGDAVLVLGTGSTPLNGLLRLAPATVASEQPRVRSFIVSMGASDRTQTLARLNSQAPSAGFDFGGDVQIDTDTREYAEQVSWLLWGMTVSVLLTCLALVIGATGEVEARRQRLRGLYVLGAGRWDLASSHFASVLLPLLVVSVSAVLAAALASIGVYLFDDRAEPSIGFLLGLFSSAVVVSAIVALTSLPSAVRALSGQDSTVVPA